MGARSVLWLTAVVGTSMLLSACGGSSHATAAASSTTTVAPTTTTSTTSTTTTTSPPRATTTTIALKEYAIADGAIDGPTHSWAVTVTDDERQCALVSFIEHLPQAVRDEVVLNNRAPSDDLQRHVAATAFAECYPRAALVTALTTSFTRTKVPFAACAAQRWAASTTPPEEIWLVLTVGTSALTPAAGAAFQTAQNSCA